MPGLSPTDINVISLGNSAHGINLGVNAFFTGTKVDVTDYTTITVMAAGNVAPAAADAIRIEWYDSDDVFLDVTIFGSNLTTFQTVHAVVRGKVMRVLYHAAGTGQSNLHIETLLRRGTISGSVAPVGFITGSPDAQIVNNLNFGKLLSGTFQPLQARVDEVSATMFNQVVVPPAPKFTSTSSTITASLVNALLDPGNTGGPTRRALEVFNDTTRGNLMIRYNLAATLTTFDVKVPPQHTFCLPQSWPMWGGTGAAGFLNGIWDFADGFARVSELR